MVPVRHKRRRNRNRKDTRLGDYGTYFNVVYLRNGILCGNLGNATVMNYLEFSIEDGRQLEEREFDVQGENAIRRMVSGAYNPDDDHVYGFSSNIDQSRWYFVKAPARNPEKTEIVREMLSRLQPSHIVLLLVGRQPTCTAWTYSETSYA